ncbi:hypothetical protein M6D93_12060 [Jatrophihabitans telluris]|uniref:LPXTG cell wall anchor domain-containing protein n=1 Tax=Jatrophihabitans telluris TaxID=2038343 RepID=A0ABY4QTJ4_9ACTN|nr:hypothetical protein [Jatrophihabitans telluris]UQX87041.1 hypothetical protein M6D93_12060 [Jatrophihabitans telluris]
MKFAVGVLLTSFGTFWGVEGAGAHWPGSDLALLAVILAVLAFALGAVGLLRRADRAKPPNLGAGPLQVSTP